MRWFSIFVPHALHATEHRYVRAIIGNALWPNGLRRQYSMNQFRVNKNLISKNDLFFCLTRSHFGPDFDAMRISCFICTPARRFNLHPEIALQFVNADLLRRAATRPKYLANGPALAANDPGSIVLTTSENDS